MNEKYECFPLNSHAQGDIRYYLVDRMNENNSGNLIVIGMNPSTANEVELDPTLRIIETIAVKNDFGRFTMLNLFPERQTNPDNLSNKIHNDMITAENINHIIMKIEDELSVSKIVSVWCCWGNISNNSARTWMDTCIREVYDHFRGSTRIKWFAAYPTESTYGLLTNGYPRHPNTKNNKTKLNGKLEKFDIEKYLGMIS